MCDDCKLSRVREPSPEVVASIDTGIERLRQELKSMNLLKDKPRDLHLLREALVEHDRVVAMLRAAMSKPAEN